jgi:hypothetical protein
VPTFAKARLLGVAHTCAQVWGPDTITVGGFCHSYLEEAFIDAVSVHGIRPVRLVRRTSDLDRRLYGDLAIMPTDWPKRNEIETLALQWLDAIERGDIATAAELYGMPYDQARADVEAPVNNERVNAFQYMFRTVDSPFADFRQPRETPQMSLFVAKERGEVTPRHIEGKEHWAVACFCRVDNCAGRWPITSLDAQNASTRPFVCATVSLMRSYNIDGGVAGVWREVTPSVEWRTLLEP